VGGALRSDGDRHGFVAVALDSGAGDPAAVEDLLDDVVARHGEPHRRYHTLTHAAAVADAVTTIAAASALTDARAALLAAWLHDVVYDTHSSGNEDASAAYAITALSALGVDSGLVDRCAHLIRVTAAHVSAALDEKVLCDADLAILAATPDRYRAYARQVRQEHDWVTDDDFRVGRAAILRTMLARDALYRTPYAAPWEAVARANIDAEIQELTETESL
jgi:predicted metal-dependent HD superfamily phosphohydrolase